MYVTTLNGVYGALRLCRVLRSVVCVTGLHPTTVGERRYSYCYSHFQRVKGGLWELRSPLENPKYTNPMFLATAICC